MQQNNLSVEDWLQKGLSSDLGHGDYLDFILKNPKRKIHYFAIWSIVIYFRNGTVSLNKSELPKVL